MVYENFLILKANTQLSAIFKTQTEQKFFWVNNLAGAKPFFLINVFQLTNKDLVFIDSARERISSYYHTISKILPRNKVFITSENHPTEKSLYLQNSNPRIFLLTKEDLERKVLKPEYWKNNRIKITRDIELKKETLVAWLNNTNYKETDFVSEPGEYAQRGSIVDIFPEGQNFPVRIEFFDNKVISIRRFDPITQRSIFLLDTEEIFLNTQTSQVFLTLKEVLSKDIILVTTLDKRSSAVNYFITINPNIKTIFLEQKPENDNPQIDFGLEAPPQYYGNLKLLKSELETVQTKYFIILSAQSRYERLADLLGNKPTYLVGELDRGFEARNDGLCVLTENELFGQHLQKLKPRKFHGQPIDDLLGLQKGDYVVHVDYGIGQFEEITKLEVQNTIKDFIKIRYAKDQRLYVPVENMNLIERYIGTTDDPPALSVLGSSRWLTLKRKARAAQERYLKELLTLYAQRNLARKIPFLGDDEWQSLVALSFPYEETPDQLTVIEEVFKDLESPHPMERLLCGDNGFGKTEVALRAAVKVLSNLKQVAVLVPSTILAYQHYQNFNSRLKELPVRIEMLSRLTPRKKAQEILNDLKRGKIDLIVGTHSLLKPEVEFYDLGLLIIDEEHKFGVLQKEQIKKLKANVDVLMLSATPIPRSLYRALIGISNISILNTPPAGRQDIITQVIYWDNDFIFEKINFELGRGGQVFFIHNEIKTIDKIYQQLKQLNPSWRIAVAHSKLPEKTLAEVYLDFIAQKYDVLLSTAIVEAGLDIPNANTIFVNRAETFGLAELHQLRGRVGRGSRQAYAFFIVSDHKVFKPRETSFNESYHKRLSALLAYSSLGAGFRLAIRDMEIRGVGNLLGPEQHGHINKIGFALYRKMLQETIAQLKNQPVKPEPVLSLDISAYIPEEYISNSFARMAIYKRLLSIEHPQEINDLRDELIDRYGQIPHTMENLFIIAKIRLDAKEAGVEKIIFKNHEINIISQGRKISLKGDLKTLIATLEKLKPHN
ncbi:MAG: transcription-repair coupling factor [candidate division WOR-3 bacterium]